VRRRRGQRGVISYRRKKTGEKSERENTYINEKAEAHTGGPDSSWEHLSSDNVAGDRVSETPAKGIDVDEDDADDAASGCAGNGLGVCAGETEVERKVEHSSGLHASANKEGNTATDAVDEERNVETCGDELDDAVDASGEEGGVGLDADELEDFGGEVLGLSNVSSVCPMLQ